MREHADPGGHYFRQLRTGDGGDDARRFLHRFGGDADDARMRVRRAHEGDVRHARERDVADVLPTALGKWLQIRPRHRAADIGIRTVERGEGWRGVLSNFHFFICILARACATASTASTMAW